MKNKKNMPIYCGVIAFGVLLITIVLTFLRTMFPNMDIHPLFNLVVVLFAIVDLLLWGFFIFLIVKKIMNKHIITKGVVTEAQYVSHTYFASINGLNLYNINYLCWCNGKLKEQKSHNHTFAEVMALKKMKNFKVKVYGNHSAIVEDLSNIEQKEEIDVLMGELNSNIVCEYCGASNNENEKKCPNCGAILKR